MAFDDLRSFLHALDQQGQLLKISEEVNAEPDLAAAANATGRIGDGAPALWLTIFVVYRRPRGDEYHRFLAEPCHLTGFAA